MSYFAHNTAVEKINSPKTSHLKRIYFAVTNDLSYDQRMIRICRSLASNGYSVVLVGRTQTGSIPLKTDIFEQKRLSCVFSRGKRFYIEYNIRLFFYLIFRRMDGICAIDLDTILPCLFVSRLKKIVRVYDAHELFSEMKEVITKPLSKKVWTGVERFAIPRYVHGYTVSQSIVEEFGKRYGAHYGLIRNVPVLREEDKVDDSMFKKTVDADNDLGKWITGERYILYQGAVNEARGLEFLIPAMQQVNCRLLICGEGNLLKECQELSRNCGLEHKVIFTGRIEPGPLAEITKNAYIGINLVEPRGLNQLFSLANKFFDYIQGTIPQVSMDFPEYRRINNELAIGLLIDDLQEKKIAAAINNLLENNVLYSMLQNNCRQARLLYNWQEEEKKLLLFYQKILN
jgi:glycosyltransferase involved in cell wall biosynthesis